METTQLRICLLLAILVAATSGQSGATVIYNACDALKPCQNDAKCSPVINSTRYNCVCQPGWNGMNCTEAVNFSPCNVNPCKNGGSCMLRPNTYGYSCHCTPSWSGQNCTAYDPCSDLDCNFGQCEFTEQNIIQQQQGRCVCPLGTTGDSCDLDVNECESGSGGCLNEGTCINVPMEGFECHCPVNISGLFCQIDGNGKLTDLCKPNPCLHGGYCNNHSPWKASCDCLPGWGGDWCEASSCSILRQTNPRRFAQGDDDQFGQYENFEPISFPDADLVIDGYCLFDGICLITSSKKLPSCECQIGHFGPRCDYNRTIVTSVGPNIGPISGGTDIIIRGYNLNGTKLPEVRLGNRYCHTKFANDTLIVCTTPRVPLTLVNTRLGIFVRYTDGSTLNKTMNETFTYKGDPTILTIHPLTTISSGGVMLNVTGTNLDVVGKPVMTVTCTYDQVPKYVFESTCTVANSTLMHCPTPKMDIFDKTGELDFNSPKPSTTEYPPYYGVPTRRRRSVSGYSAAVLGKLATNWHRSRRDLLPDTNFQINNQTVEFFIGLNLDGVRKYRNMTEAIPMYSQMTVYKDPLIHPWGEEQEVRVGRTQLEVKGERLQLGIRGADYKMVIGQSECEKLDVFDNKLVCRAPEGIPTSHPRDTKPGQFSVLVHIGILKEPFLVGSVRYHISFWDNPTNKWAVIGACLVGGVLLLILAAFFVARRTTK